MSRSASYYCICIRLFILILEIYHLKGWFFDGVRYLGCHFDMTTEMVKAGACSLVAERCK